MDLCVSLILKYKFGECSESKAQLIGCIKSINCDNYVHYKIAQLYVAYDVSYRIEILSVQYDTTTLYAAKSLCI